MFSAFLKNRNTTETLREYTDSRLSLFGRVEYAYTVISKKNPSDILIISTYPAEWVEYYRTGSLQLTDPVILTAMRRASPFVWNDDITLISDLKLARVFSQSRQYNIVNGFTFVLHDHMNNLALLSFIIHDNAQQALEARLASERGTLQMILIDINAQMYRLAGVNSSALQKHHMDRVKPILSPRENEVLYWSGAGKTYAEIAAITGISLSTVKFHMRNIVSRLGVSNARQAIRLAVELDLITATANS